MVARLACYLACSYCWCNVNDTKFPLMSRLRVSAMQRYDVRVAFCSLGPGMNEVNVNNEYHKSLVRETSLFRDLRKFCTSTLRY